MNGRAPFRQTASALGAGVLVGVVLVTAFGFLSASGDALLPPLAAARASFLFSILYAPAIAALSALVWWLISKFGMEGPVAAAGLGFVMTSAVWFLTNQPLSAPTLDNLAVGVCGAMAGLATWWVANRR